MELAIAIRDGGDYGCCSSSCSYKCRKGTSGVDTVVSVVVIMVVVVVVVTMM